MKYKQIREEELKNKVGADWFKMVKHDIAIAAATDYRNHNQSTKECVNYFTICLLQKKANLFE